MNDKIEIKLPSKPEYISLVRLTASSIANNKGLNIDEIEDLKVSLSEACTNVINFNDSEELNILFTLKEDGIYVDIEDVLEDIPEDLDNAKQGQMGLLIINSLMDKVEFKDTGITMVKYI
nr:ATP-binding protein [Tissierella sp.]